MDKDESADRRKMLKELERIYGLVRALKDQHDREFTAIHREMLNIFSEISHSLPIEARVRAAVVHTDELYPEAEKLVRAHGSASASFLQSKLGVGYARASSLLDMLEERGVISPARGSAPRKVYMTPEAEKVLRQIEMQLQPKKKTAKKKTK